MFPFPGPAAKLNQITEVTRRNIIDPLLLGDYSFYGRMEEVAFLGRVWDLTNMPPVDRREPNMEADLRRHLGWGDYDDSQVLYSLLNITRCPDEQFGNFLTECLHPLVRTDAVRVAELLASFNKHLAADGFVLIERSRLSGYPIYGMADVGSAIAMGAQQYDVALSFAGEQREYVDIVATKLREARINVFYYPFEEAHLWGKDLTEAFERVFLHGARFVVMFSSEEYGRKMWPNYERRAAVERAMAEREEYILPVRFDDTKIPGIRDTVAYLDARVKAPRDIVRMIIEKLGRTTKS